MSQTHNLQRIKFNQTFIWLKWHKIYHSSNRSRSGLYIKEQWHAHTLSLSPNSRASLRSLSLSTFIHKSEEEEEASHGAASRTLFRNQHSRFGIISLSPSFCVWFPRKVKNSQNLKSKNFFFFSFFFFFHLLLNYEFIIGGACFGLFIWIGLRKH